MDSRSRISRTSRSRRRRAASSRRSGWRHSRRGSTPTSPAGSTRSSSASSRRSFERTRCASGCAHSRCSRSIAPDVSPTRSTRTRMRARRSSPSSASSQAPSSRSCSRRSSPRTSRCVLRRRRPGGGDGAGSRSSRPRSGLRSSPRLWQRSPSATTTLRGRPRSWAEERSSGSTPSRVRSCVTFLQGARRPRSRSATAPSGSWTRTRARCFGSFRPHASSRRSQRVRRRRTSRSAPAPSGSRTAGACRTRSSSGRWPRRWRASIRRRVRSGPRSAFGESEARRRISSTTTSPSRRTRSGPSRRTSRSCEPTRRRVRSRRRFATCRPQRSPAAGGRLGARGRRGGRPAGRAFGSGRTTSIDHSRFGRIDRRRQERSLDHDACRRKAVAHRRRARRIGRSNRALSRRQRRRGHLHGNLGRESHRRNAHAGRPGDDAGPPHDRPRRHTSLGCDRRRDRVGDGDSPIPSPPSRPR